MNAIIAASAGHVGSAAWSRLLAACILSALLHWLLLIVPLTPPNGNPNVITTLQARLAPAQIEARAQAPSTREDASAKQASRVADGAEKTAAEKTQTEPTSKPIAQTTASSAGGIESQWVGDPTFYPARQMDVYPLLAEKIQPTCPAAALAQRIEGRVQLLVLIDEFGVVKEASVVEAQPADLFNDAAVQVLRGARFVPAFKQGNRVKSRMVMRVNFPCSEAEIGAR
jgi:protein TonB